MGSSGVSAPLPVFPGELIAASRVCSAPHAQRGAGSRAEHLTATGWRNGLVSERGDAALTMAEALPAALKPALCSRPQPGPPEINSRAESRPSLTPQRRSIQTQHGQRLNPLVLEITHDTYYSVPGPYMQEPAGVSSPQALLHAHCFLQLQDEKLKQSCV